MLRFPWLSRGVLAASLVLCGWVADAQGNPGQAEELTGGMQLQRPLTAGAVHAYAVALQSGAAILGKVEQRGIDVVIDVYGPDGKQLARLDSPNGTNGPEPFDFTARSAGTYRFVVHVLDAHAQPGAYTMTVDQVLPPEENAKRLAKQNYPPALYDLWLASLTDPQAVDRFMADRRGKSPVLDVAAAGPSEMRVTYICLGDDDTERVVFHGGPEFGVVIRRLGKSNLFLGTQLVPSDARFEYSFALREVHHLGPRGEVEVAEATEQGPWLLEMPGAPRQPYVTVRPDISHGKTETTGIVSAALKEERKITVYTPPGYDGHTPADLLIVFDGVTYGAVPEQTEVPTPTILDNLLAEKKIRPTIAILVWTMGKRMRDLTGSKPFADFVADELIPWARAHYRIAPGPKAVVLAGSSIGGFAAAHCAFQYPQAIGNVLSQSGAYWITDNWQSVRPPYPHDTGLAIEEFKHSKRLPIRFYMEVGRFDLGAALLGSNRELRDVLEAKGYAVDYHEFDGGHDYAAWRGSLADGLTVLLGNQ